MENVHTVVDEVQPRLLKMRSGRWLAVSEPGSRLTLGVDGETPDQALGLFREAVQRWRTILDKPLEGRI